MIKTCTGCGWEFPSHYTRTKCKFCNALLDKQDCIICKRVIPTDQFYTYKSGKNKGYIRKVCRECGVKRSDEWAKNNPKKNVAKRNRYIAYRKDTAENELYVWLHELAEVDFKPMSEEQWLKACAYFNGCAICGNEHIERREFFIKFQEGGRYAAWNMLPLCRKCGRTKQVNPFKWMDVLLGTAHKEGLTKERKERIIDYLRRCADEQARGV